MFAFYAKNDGLRITDLHQGIVWGTQTAQTARDARLINRFDYDGDYGTVLNRFLMQAAIGHPLTVHGTGGQTRAFIHIQDTVRCIEIALENPPQLATGRWCFNQVTETYRVRDLAKLVSGPDGRRCRLTCPIRGRRPRRTTWWCATTVPRTRPRADHAVRRAAGGVHRDRPALPRPGRPEQDHRQLGLASRHGDRRRPDDRTARRRWR